MANESLVRNEEIVDGKYRLGALMSRSPEEAVYRTEFGEGESAVLAVIRLRQADPAEAEKLQQRLLEIARLDHPNLLKIYAAGSSTLDGASVFYVVMERAEESLEAVLAERSLTIGETREMLAPALEALGYLHKMGYVHAGLGPSAVVAVNDQLKLSTESVVRVEDVPVEDLRGEDLRALGVLIVQALTRRLPNPDEPWEAQDFGVIPQPLADIARHCLDPNPATRWTVEQVKAKLNAPPVLVEKLSRWDDDPEAAAPKPGIPKWIYAALAALIVVVILAAVLRSGNSRPAATPVASTDATAAPNIPVPRVEAPPAPVANRPAATRTDVRKTSGWSVIMGAYRSRELAEKRLRAITKKWPEFEISVIESHGEKAPYLLVLGRNLSEDQAESLRKRAVQARLPGDTYIKRVL